MTSGPRQMTGESSSRKKPIDISRRPYFSSGEMRLFSATCGRPLTPSMIGRLGP